MAKTEVVIYQERDGQVPLLEWLDNLPSKAQDKCIALIERLAEAGHELRRPHCDFLEQGIYELRAGHANVHYRILYAFVGRNVVLLAYGCLKERRVPRTAINKAVGNLNNYLQNPKAHTYFGEL